MTTQISSLVDEFTVSTDAMERGIEAANAKLDAFSYCKFVDLESLDDFVTREPGCVNTDSFDGCLPGTLRIGEMPRNPDGSLIPNSDGSYTIRFEYRRDGWDPETGEPKS